MVMFTISSYGRNEGNDVNFLEQQRAEGLFMLRPYVGPLIRSTLRNITVARTPQPHLYFLRTLVRHVGMDPNPKKNNPALIQLHTEFSAAFPAVIDTLLRLHPSCTEAADRESIVEICLTLPMRLNMQVQHLPKSLQPVILGLRSRDDRKNLVTQALSVLEFLIDNIAPECFHQIFTADPGLQNDLFTAMTALLKPTAASNERHGRDVVKLLGKLGGLNRLHLSQAPKLQHVGYTSNGLVVRAKWNQAPQQYMPPSLLAEHDQAKLEAIFEGSDPGAVTAAANGSVGSNAAAGSGSGNDDVAMDGTGSPAHDATMKSAMTAAQQAIANLRAAGKLPGGASSSSSSASTAGKKRRASESSAAGAGAPSSTAAPPAGDGPAPASAAPDTIVETEFEMPLDRVVHYAGGMLVRHFDVVRDSTISAAEFASLMPSVAARATAKRRQTVRTVRKRSQPSQRVGTNAGDDSGSPGSCAVPIPRRRRMSASGEPEAVFSTGSTKGLLVDPFATAASGGRVTAYQESYDSDSDSSGDDDTYEVGPVTLTPNQGMRLAQRGPQSAKRQAWELLHAVLPIFLHQFPALGNANNTSVSAHLYTIASSPASGAGTGSTAGTAASASPSFLASRVVVATALPLPAVNKEPPSHSLPPARQPCHPTAALPGYPTTAPALAAATEKAVSMRRVQLEYLRSLAIACADNQLRPAAYPVLMGLVRRYVARAVSITPRPPADLVPACLTAAGTAASASASSGPSVPRVPYHRYFGTLNSAEDDAELFDVHVDEEAPKAANTDASSRVPPGGEDPMVLNILIMSLACDEPLAAMGTAAFRPVILSILDEMHGTLCALSRGVGANASGAASAAGDGDVSMDQTSDAAHAHSTSAGAADLLTVDVAIAAADDSRRLEAACVTGRLLLGDLVTRLVTAVYRPSFRAKQGACQTLIALLARAHPVIAQLYMTDLVRAGYFVLRSFLPEQSAITVACAMHLLRDTMRLGVPALPEGAKLPFLKPLEDIQMDQADHNRLRTITRISLEALLSPTAAAREGSVFVLGAVAKAFLRREVLDNQTVMARAIFTLMHPWMGSLSPPSLFLTLLLNRPAKLMRHSDMIGHTLTICAILHLAAQAIGDGSSSVDDAGVDTATAASTSAAGSTGSSSASSTAGGVPTWRRTVNAFISNEETVHAISSWLKDALRITRAYDPNSVILNPAYNSSIAHWIGERGIERLTGLKAPYYGISAAPITVSGAIAAIKSPALPENLQMSSAVNPPIEPPRTPAELHTLLAATQAFPYPIAWPPGRGSASAKAVDTISDGSSDALDPFQVEQISDGRLYAHYCNLPLADIDSSGAASGAASSASASSSSQGLPPWGVPTWPSHMNSASLLEGGQRYEEMLRGKLQDPNSEFRALAFPVLFRCAVLRLVEAFNIAIPEPVPTTVAAAPVPAAETAPADGEPDAASAVSQETPAPPPPVLTQNQTLQAANMAVLRENAMKLFFEMIPLLPDPPNAPRGNYYVHPDASIGPVYDKSMPIFPQSTGHYATLLSAVHDAMLAVTKRQARIVNDTTVNSFKELVRPILMMVSDHKTMKMFNIETLAAIFPALGRFFNDALTMKFLDHLSQWIGVNTIRSDLGNSGREPDIAAAILNLFHVAQLNPNAVLPRLTNVVCLLEAKLHQFRSKGPLTSPFRVPFARLMSKYPSEAADWFFSERRLLNPSYGKLFMACIALPEAAAMREYLCSAAGEDHWLAAAFPDIYQPNGAHAAAVKEAADAAAATATAAEAGRASVSATTSEDVTMSDDPNKSVTVTTVKEEKREGATESAQSASPAVATASAVPEPAAAAPPIPAPALTPAELAILHYRGLQILESLQQRDGTTSKAAEYLPSRPHVLSLAVKVWHGADFQSRLFITPAATRPYSGPAIGSIKMAAAASASMDVDGAGASSSSSSPGPADNGIAASIERNGGVYVPWSISRTLWEGYFNDVQLVLQMMVRLVRQAVHKARSVAAARASDDQHAIEQASALPSCNASQVAVLLRAICSTVNMNARLPFTETRYFLETEVASVPSVELRRAILRTFVSTDVHVGSAAAAVPDVMDDAVRSSGIRCLVLPMLRHVAALEDEVAAVLQDQGRDACARAYLAAGGAPEAAAAIRAVAQLGPSVGSAGSSASSASAGDAAHGRITPALSGDGSRRSRAGSFGVETMDGLSLDAGSIGGAHGLSSHTAGSTMGGMADRAWSATPELQLGLPPSGVGHAAADAVASHSPAPAPSGPTALRTPAVTFAPIASEYTPGAAVSGLGAAMQTSTFKAVNAAASGGNFWGAVTPNPAMPHSAFGTPASSSYGRALAAGLGSAGTVRKLGIFEGSSVGMRTPAVPHSAAGAASITSITWADAVFAYTPPHRGGSYQEIPAEIQKGSFHKRHPFPRLLDRSWTTDFKQLLSACYDVSTGKIPLSSADTHWLSQAVHTPGVATSSADGGTPARDSASAAASSGSGAHDGADAGSAGAAGQAGVRRGSISGSSLPPVMSGVGPSEELKVELLRLMDASIVHSSYEMSDHRKVLVRFAWALLKSQDLTVKQYAYISISRYLAVYDSPHKTPIQVMTSLLDMLKSQDHPGRSQEQLQLPLWRRAVNLLLPTLPLRLPQEDWKLMVRALRKRVCDELHSLQVSFVLWSVILDHARLFFAYRLQIIPNIVSMAHRLVTSQQTTLQQKEMLVTLMQGVSVWQAQARLESLMDGLRHIEPSSKVVDDTSASAPGTPASVSASSVTGSAPRAPRRDLRDATRMYPTLLAGWGGWDVLGHPEHGRGENLALTEWIVGFTARSAIMCSESADSRPMVKRTIDMLASMFRLWPDVPLGRTYLSKTVPQQTSSSRSRNRNEEGEAHLSYLCTTLEILIMLSNVEGRARDFLPENVGFVMDIFVSAMASFDRTVLTLTRRLIRRFLMLYPLQQPPQRLQHVRFYPCVASAIVLRLGPITGLDHQKTSEFAKAIADAFATPPEVRTKARAEHAVLTLIAHGVIPAPGGGPQIPSDPKTIEQLQQYDLPQALKVAPRAWPEYTQERAKILLAQDDSDDNEARKAWQNVSSMLGSPPPIPSLVAQEVLTLQLIRILRDCVKYAQPFNQHMSQLTWPLLHRLVTFHMECEEVTTKQARVEPGVDWRSTLSFQLLPADHTGQEQDPHLIQEVRSISSASLAILIPMLCTRHVFLSNNKSIFISYVGRLLANSSDAGILRTCMKVLSSWFTAAPQPRSSISYGLSIKEKSALLESALVYLAIQPSGSAHTHKDVVVRIQKLPQELYNSLQADYYRLLLRMFTGSDTIASDPRSAFTFMRQAYKLLHPASPGSQFVDPEPLLPHLASSWSRPSTTWFAQLYRFISPGVICAEASVRQRCFNLMVAHARVRRVFELREEVNRTAVSRSMLRSQYEVNANKRRGDAFRGMVSPIVHFPVADPFNSAYKLPLSSEDLTRQAAEGARNNLPEGSLSTRFWLVAGEDVGEAHQQVWHSNLDVNTAAALESAYAAALGVSRDGARNRLCSYSGVSAPSEDGYPDALTGLQDMVTFEFEHIVAYASLPTLCRLLVRALHKSARGVSSGEASSVAAALSQLTDALDCALPFSVDLALSVWVDLLPRAWKAITPEQRERLTPQIVAMVSRDVHNHQLAAGNALKQLEASIGVWVKERDREFGPGPTSILSSYSWNSHAGSSAAADAIVGSAATVLGPVEDVAYGSIYAPRGLHDLWSAASLQMLMAGIVKCEPQIEIPTEVLSALARGLVGTGLQDLTVPRLEAKLESSIANVRVLEEKLYNEQAKIVPPPPPSASPATLGTIVHVSNPAISNLSMPLHLDSKTVLDQPASTSGDVYLQALAPLPLRDGLRDDGMVHPPQHVSLAAKQEAAVNASQLRIELAQARHDVTNMATTLSGVYSSMRADDMSRGIRRRFATTLPTVRALDQEAAALWQDVAETTHSAIVNTREVVTQAYREDSDGRKMQMVRLRAAVQAVLQGSKAEQPASAAAPGAGAASVAAAAVNGATASGAQPVLQDAPSAGGAAIVASTEGVAAATAAAAGSVAPAASTEVDQAAVQPADAALATDASNASAAAAAAATELVAALPRKQLTAAEKAALAADRLLSGKHAGIVAGSKRGRPSVFLGLDDSEPYMKETISEYLTHYQHQQNGSGASSSLMAPPAASPGAGAGAASNRLQLADLGATSAAARPSMATAKGSSSSSSSAAHQQRLALLRNVSTSDPVVARAHVSDEFDAAALYADTNGTGPAKEQHQGSAAPYNLPISERYDLPSASEVAHWEERWVESLKHLGEWKALQKYSEFTDDHVLYAEALNKAGAWNELQNSLSSSPALSLESARSHQAMLMQVDVFINKREVVEASNSLDEVSSQWLKEWHQLPPFPNPAHELLLAQTQRITEAREAIGVAMGLDQAIQKGHGAQAVDIKGVINTWRERLPNKWDPPAVWDSILTWRQHIFSLVASLQPSTMAPDALAQLQDSHWTSLKAAHIARKLGLANLAATTLERVDPAVGDIHDIYARHKEQWKLYLPDKITTASARYRWKVYLGNVEARLASNESLHNINPPWMQQFYFDDAIVKARLGLAIPIPPGSEIFLRQPRYNAATLIARGQFLETIGQRHWPSAYVAYAGATTANHAYGKGWLVWGEFLDRLFQMVRIESRIPHIVAADQAAKAAAALPPAAMDTDQQQQQRPERNPLFLTAEMVAKFAGQTPAPLTVPQPPAAAAAPTSAAAGAGAGDGAGEKSSSPAPTSAAAATSGDGSATAAAASPPAGAASSSSSTPAPAQPAERPKPSLATIVAAQAVTAYLAAVAMKAGMAPLQLARVLQLVSYEDGSGLLVSALTMGVGAVPVWVWLNWLPQLLIGLTRPESEACRRVLMAVGIAYPHAVLPLLNGYYHDRAEAVAAGSKIGQRAYERCWEILNFDRFQATFDPWNRLAEEINLKVARFSFEDDMLTALCQTTSRAQAVAMNVCNTRISLLGQLKAYTQHLAALRASGKAADSTAVTDAEKVIEQQHAKLAQWKEREQQMVESTHKQFSALTARFGQSSQHASSGARGETSRSARFIARYKKAFMLDFLPQVPVEFLTSPPAADADTAGVADGDGQHSSKKRRVDAASADSNAAASEASASAPAPASPPTSSSSPDVANSFAPQSAEQLVTRLRLWITRIKACLALRNVNFAVDPHCHSSAVEGQTNLIDSIQYSVHQMPGQYQLYAADVEPIPANHVKIAHLDARMHVAMVAGVPQKRLTFIGDDGRKHVYGVSTTQTVSSSPSMADARLAQVASMTNVLLSRFHSSRQRHLSFGSQVSVPIPSKADKRARLTLENPSTLMLQDVLEERLQAIAAAAAASNAGTSLPSTSDDLLVYYRSRLLKHASRDSDEVLLRSYRDVCAFFPDTSLATVLASRMSSPEALGALRDRFRTQVATNNVWSWLFHAVDRTASRTGIQLSNGNVVNLEARPNYSPAVGTAPNSSVQIGHVVENEAAPFRLTRNMTSLITYQGVVGPVAASMIASTRAMFQNFEWMHAFLLLYFRDDVAQWLAARMSRQGANDAAAGEAVDPYGVAVTGAGATAQAASGLMDPGALQRRVTHNATSIMSQVFEFSRAAHGPSPHPTYTMFDPNVSNRKEAAAPAPLAQQVAPADCRDLLAGRVHQLLVAAMSDKYHARMPQVWHPWM